MQTQFLKTWAAAAAALFLAVASASAQTTTGTVSGRVIDSQGLALPGVTVTAASPNMQGVRTVVTSENGDYLFSALPSGTYTMTFELSGFQNQQRTVAIAPTQVVPLDVTLGVATLSEVVNVVGQTADVLTRTAQVVTNFKQDLIASLPTTRDINSSLLLAPAVHPTGPSGAYSVAGAMSFETLYMVNGVNVSENLRGQAYDLYIEDAIQETNIATSGISAEYGRFGGGVVNVITKSGGNLFSGSFRDTLNNDNWRTLTPFEGTQIANDPAHKEVRVAKTVPTYEYTLGGPVMKDHLWFFTAGRLQNQELGRSLVFTNIPYTFTDDTRRFEGKGTFSFNPNNTFQGAYTKITQNQTDNTFNTSASMDLRSLYNRQLPEDLFTANYNGILSSNVMVEARVSSRRFSFIGDGAPTTDLIDGTLLLDRARNSTRYWSPTFCGVCDPEKRDNTDFFAKGTYFRTHSLFYNDNWRINGRLTANLGLRYDRNHGADSAGRVVAQDSAFSPRAGIVWDPTGDQKWSVTGSFAKYVAAISNSIADSSSPAGNPQSLQFVYRGPAINANPNGPLLSSPDALVTLFSWFNANGGANLPLNGAPTIPGVTPQIQGSLDSPNNLEYAVGVNRSFGARAALRADYVFRNFRDFYVSVLDMSTGRTTDQLGKQYDLGLVQNSNDLTRRYSGLTTQATYRFGTRADIGGTYTLSRAWGNVEGENVGSGPITSTAFQYPEYKQAAWNYPIGDLSIDQRHRARLWANYNLPWVSGLGVSVLQTLTSGVPYGALGPIATQPYVTNPGYLTPPPATGGAAVTYYFTARDAFHTEGERRTDLAVNYTFKVPSARNTQLFAQMQVVNLFNQFQLCGCGGTVFQNGGPITQTRIDQSVLTASTNANQFTAFNPFTTTPVQGTNWALGPSFGTALNRFAYTTPRELRVSFGVRF